MVQKSPLQEIFERLYEPSAFERQSEGLYAHQFLLKMNAHFKSCLYSQIRSFLSHSVMFKMHISPWIIKRESQEGYRDGGKEGGNGNYIVLHLTYYILHYEY